MTKVKYSFKNNNAFTLVELILIMGLFSLLVMISGINLIKPQVSASIDTTVNQIVSDLKSQQIKSMSGSTDGLSSSQNFGIYFESDKYTLFTGSSYNSSDSRNFIVHLATGLSLSNNLTSSQIVFSKINGEIVSYTSGSYVQLSHSSGGSQIINISSLGVVDLP